MNKIIILFFLLFSIFLNASTLELTINEKNFIKKHPEIIFGAERDWPPFDFIENGKHKGIAKDYLHLIEHKTGLKFISVVDSWENLLKKAKNKEIDLLPMLSKTAKREKFLLFTKNFLQVRDYVFAKESLNLYNLEELNTKTIAIAKGYVEGDYFKKNYPKVKILDVNNIIEAYDAVITGKADFLVSNLPLINFITNKYSLNGIDAKFHMKYDAGNHYMGIRNDYPELRSILQKALDNITNEEKNTISTRWIDKNKTNQNNSSVKLTNEEKKFILNNKKIYIANELDWLPYDYNENGKPKGYVIDYVKILLNNVGLKPIFITDTWPNLMKRFKTGEINILPVITYNEKRKEFLNFSTPYSKQNMTIVTKKVREDIIHKDDLDGKRIGLVKNWNSTKIIKEFYPEFDVIEYDNLKNVFNALEDNHIDATIQNEMLATYYINSNHPNTLKLTRRINIRNFKNELLMGINKDKKPLLSIINKSIDQITQLELNSLDKKWLNISTKLNLTNEEKDFIDTTIINIAYVGKWAPIGFTVENKPYGLGYDFWDHVVNKTNLKVKVNPVHSFSRGLDTIKNKTNDIIVTTSKLKEREKYAIFSDVYYKTPIGIATLKDQNYISDASKLIGKKVGVDKNSTAHSLVKKYFPNIKFVFINDIEDGLKKLSNNEIYALIDNMPVLTHNIKKYGHSNIKISGDTGIDFNLQVMIRDDYILLQSIINKVLSNITPTEKEKIYNKWTKIEYTNSFDYSLIWKIFIPFIIIILVILYKNRQLVQYQKTLKRTQDKLEDSLKSFKTLVNLTIEGIIIVKDKKIVFSNNESLKIFDYGSTHEFVEQDLEKLFASYTIDINEIIHNSNSKTYELQGIKKSKEKFPILIKSKKLTFDNEQSNIISIIDMSEIKNKENLLAQQSKMASLGEMIGNIAHQWRQPLSLISTAASGMKIQKQYGQLEDKMFFETVNSITDTTKFLSQTIDDFQNYIKDDKIKKEFNINNSVHKVLNIIKGAFVNHHINVQLQLDESIHINSYENELNQVLLNILNNSKDALKEIEKDDRYISISTYKKSNQVFIEIVDNGGGIDINIINKIFEPYFTTKHKSQGTGLGLYMTHKIVTESINGKINIINTKYTFKENTFDKCTKILIELPFS